MMSEQNNDAQTVEPPKYDTLHVKFKGDDYHVVLPYCEVANGHIMGIGDNLVDIVSTKGGAKDQVTLSFDEFTQVVEHTFDTKRIVSLSIQKASSYTLHKIL